MTKTTWHVVQHMPEWARSFADSFPAVVTDPGDDGRIVAGCDSVLNSHENAKAIARQRNNLRAMADQLDAARKIIHDVRLFARSCDNSGPEDGGNYTYLEVARALRRILGDDK